MYTHNCNCNLRS